MIDFKKPDIWLAAIDFGDCKVSAIIKNDFAQLESVPPLSTGFFFKDIVRVVGPIGETYFRDEKIPVFRAIGLERASGIDTFRFEVLLPSKNDWFDLSDLFREHSLSMSLPFTESQEKALTKGICAARNLQEAKCLLELFVASGKGRMAKIFSDDNSQNVLAEEISGINFKFELAHEKNKGVILFILLFPTALFIAVAFKVGFQSFLDYYLFFGWIILWCTLASLLNLKTKREKIVLAHDGILAFNIKNEEKFIAWGEISAMRYNKRTSNLTISGKDNSAIVVNKGIIGFRRFASITESRVHNPTIVTELAIALNREAHLTTRSS